MAVFGMVMLVKPIVSFSLVMVKDIIVDLADWFVAIVASNICRLIMFPSKTR